MYGAIIGDLAGSIYEYNQFKKVEPVKMNKIIEDNAFISDDTILTMSLIDSILNKKCDYYNTLKEYIIKYNNLLPKDIPYFKTMFSPGIMKWVNSDGFGNSLGNGCMMRISPVGYLFDREEDVIENVRKATIPTHNNPDSIKCATTIALIIYYLRKGLSRNDIIKKLELVIKYNKFTEFNYLAMDTIDNVLYILFNSNSFEDAIKSSLLMGGDTDTNTCIVGSMAEALYGINDQLIRKANNYLPSEFKKLLKCAYRRINNIK